MALPRNPKFHYSVNVGPLFDHIVTCLLKAGIAEPEDTSVPRQFLCKHCSAATITRMQQPGPPGGGNLESETVKYSLESRGTRA